MCTVIGDAVSSRSLKVENVDTISINAATRIRFAGAWARIDAHLLAVTTAVANVVEEGSAVLPMTQVPHLGEWKVTVLKASLRVRVSRHGKMPLKGFARQIALRKTRESSIFALERYEQNKLRASVY